MKRYHGELGVHAESPACADIGCVLDDGSHDGNIQKYDDLHQRYLIACQELADVREALAGERRRRLDIEVLLSDITEMLIAQIRKP